MRFITDPLATVLGFIISSVYNFFSGMGIESVALSIFILTLFIRLLLSPLSINMTKSTRIQQHLKPEFDKINKKYKGKKDQNSMIRQQQETKDLQKRYGIKMSTGCLTTLIQFPIIIALYQVIREVSTYLDAPSEAYNFFAIDLTATPSVLLKEDLWHNFHYAIIPILCCVFQVLSMISTPQTLSGDPQQDATAKSMRRSMMIMPVFSLFVTFSVPSGVGFYWAASSLLSYLIQIGTKIYFDHADMDKIVEKQRVRAEKKYEKDKNSGKKSFLEKLQEAALGESSADTSEETSKNMQQYGSKSLKHYTNTTSSSDSSDTTTANVNLKKGSLASKANAMARLNEKGDK